MSGGVDVCRCLPYLRPSQESVPLMAMCPRCRSTGEQGLFGRSRGFNLIHFQCVRCGGQGRVSSPLADMDWWTDALLSGLIPPLLTDRPVTDSMLAEPLPKGGLTVQTLSCGGVDFHNLEHDPSCGDFSMGQWIELQLLLSKTLLPIQDIPDVDLPDEELESVLAILQLDKTMPKGNHEIINPESDDALTQIAFFGMGAHRVQVVDLVEAKSFSDLYNPKYKVDLTSMESLKVRAGFEAYGACAYFDQDKRLLFIKRHGQLLSPRDGEQWAFAKFAWRSSLMTLVMIVDHLYQTHFAVAAQFLRASAEALSDDHPVKRAAQPFTMRTALVNNKAGSALIPENSIMHHITALEYDAFGKLAATEYLQGPEWTALPQQLSDKGDWARSLPLYEDGLDLFSIFRAYWERVLVDIDVENDDELESFFSRLRDYTTQSGIGSDCTSFPEKFCRDGLLNVLSQFCFVVTAYHEHVGSVGEYLATPRHMAVRIRPNSARADKQSFLGACALISVTSLKTPPLMSMFETFWRTDFERDCWSSLQGELQVLSDEIQERNRSRAYPVYSCNPRFLECAVSV